MKTYQKPVVSFESFECVNAVGQYIFEFTPENCLGAIGEGFVGQEGGYARCSEFVGSSFIVDITCENIEGTFTVVYGDSVDGGGLDCDEGESIFYPEVSVTPELPANCVVNSFAIQNSIELCNAS
jgi:hypothetical protein